jgi:hypothetical protein
MMLSCYFDFAIEKALCGAPAPLGAARRSRFVIIDKRTDI